MLFPRIERNLDGSQSKFTSKESSRDIADNDVGRDNKTSNEARPLETPSILKYIKTQVTNLFSSDLKVIAS